jgi:hypothetical protein
MTDPIYASIDAHRKAYQHWSDAVAVAAVLRSTDPRYRPAETETNRLGAVKADSKHDLNSTMPTTIAGCAALAEYCVALYRRNESEISELDFAEALANIARALRKMAAA